jgi:CheY-like chemotaxis protein
MRCDPFGIREIRYIPYDHPLSGQANEFWVNPDMNDVRFRILAVDDEPQATQTLKRILERRGYLVAEENDSSKALETAKAFHPDVVIVDYLMPNTNGGDVAWQLASEPSLKSVKVIMCSGLDPREFRRKLPPTKIPILQKPLDPLALLELLPTN